MNAFTPYYPCLVALWLTGSLLLLQLLVADLAGIRAGHQAGYPIPADRNRFLFRAARAHANTNESVSAFVLLAFAGMLLGAAPAWLNGLAALYVAARLAHMACYYANAKTARSASFAVSVVALLGMALAAGLSL